MNNQYSFTSEMVRQNNQARLARSQAEFMEWRHNTEAGRAWNLGIVRGMGDCLGSNACGTCCGICCFILILAGIYLLVLYLLTLILTSCGVKRNHQNMVIIMITSAVTSCGIFLGCVSYQARQSNRNETNDDTKVEVEV